MRVRHPFPVRTKIVTPDKRFAGEAPARRELPFRLGRQSLPSPFCVGSRVLIRDLNDRIISFAANVAFWTARVPPVGTLHIAPPLQVIVERHRMVGWRKNN